MPDHPVALRLLASVAPCLALAACDSAPPPQAAREPVRKLLMMHYMPWYETPAVRGKWGKHWTGHENQHDPSQLNSGGRPDIFSHYFPLIGTYDSTDPAVLECHLLQMKLAGVDGVIVDWYGLGQAADYPPIHDATSAMFDATGRFGMKFAACYEDRAIKFMVENDHLAADKVTEHLAETFEWMHGEWFMAPRYLRLHGRPLLLNFGPIHVKDAGTWSKALAAPPERPMFYALHHLWQNVGADGGFTWVHRQPWQGEPEPNAATIRKDLTKVLSAPSKNPDRVIASAFPGYHDIYPVNTPDHVRHQDLDHRDGRTLRESLGAAMAGRWQTIQLVTWNDYGEGTMIEPTREFGYTFLEIIQEARRKELGDHFRFTADDLRLPARLLELRKAGTAPAAELDQISRLLSEGACAEARSRLDQLRPNA